MSKESSLGKEVAKIAATCTGAIVCITGAVLGATVVLEQVQEKLIEGLQEAYSGSSPVMAGPAEPFRQRPETIGTTAKDYSVPGGIALTELGIAGYALWRLTPRKATKAMQTVAVPGNHETCELSPREAQAFASIIQREFRQP
jgi:hypothetical protein